MYGVLAEHIFTGSNVDQEHCREHGKDPTWFAWSTQQQFAWWVIIIGLSLVNAKITWYKAQKEVPGTYKEAEVYKGRNVPWRQSSKYDRSVHAHWYHIENICNEWPFWDNLHAIWRELLNYNPVGICNAEGGQNYSEQAAHYFRPRLQVQSSSHTIRRIQIAMSQMMQQR